MEREFEEIQEIELDKSSPGRLPSIDRFWVHLQAAKKAPRTIKSYKYEYKFWLKASHNKIYFLKAWEIENIVKDLHLSTARKRLAFLKKLGQWYLRENKQKLHIELAKIELPKHAKRIPKDLGHETFLEYRELAKQLYSQGKREGLFISLMLMAGLRISEIKGAQISSKNKIHVIGKGNKQRVVSCPPSVVKAMQNIKGEGRGGWRLGRKRIWKLLSLMNIFNPHSLRHTFASELIRKKVPIEQIKELLGHESIATTSIYTQIDIMDVSALLDE